LYNDFNHFYFDNIKFASLNVIHDLKEKRSEEKDLRDIEMMKGALV